MASKLGLVPDAATPWSEVFSHEVTLAAPGLFADAMPGVDDRQVEVAVNAHLLAVIEAFCADRIEDGQVRATPALCGLSLQLTTRCEQLLAALSPDAPRDYRLARQRASRAAGLERMALRGDWVADWVLYDAISLAKQEVAFSPSVALARAAGWSPRRQGAVRSCLASVALGLQAADDLADWEDDVQQGGAWVAALASGADRQDVRGSIPVSMRALRQRVFGSGILAALAERAKGHFGAARRRARALGADRLALWAEGEEQREAELAKAERAYPGISLRAHKLRLSPREAIA